MMMFNGLENLYNACLAASLDAKLVLKQHQLLLFSFSILNSRSENQLEKVRTSSTRREKRCKPNQQNKE